MLELTGKWISKRCLAPGQWTKNWIDFSEGTFFWSRDNGHGTIEVTEWDGKAGALHWREGGHNGPATIALQDDGTLLVHWRNSPKYCRQEIFERSN